VHILIVEFSPLTRCGRSVRLVDFVSNLEWTPSSVTPPPRPSRRARERRAELSRDLVAPHATPVSAAGVCPHPPPPHPLPGPINLRNGGQILNRVLPVQTIPSRVSLFRRRFGSLRPPRGGEKGDERSNEKREGKRVREKATVPGSHRDTPRRLPVRSHARAIIRQGRQGAAAACSRTLDRAPLSRLIERDRTRSRARGVARDSFIDLSIRRFMVRH